MLQPIAEGVLVHVSEFIQSNSVVVDGVRGVLLVDPGVTRDELASIAGDLRERSSPVVAAFATHADWDHVLWHPDLGGAPRYATAGAAESIREVLSSDDWPDQIAEGLPPEHADEIPMDLLGLLTALPADAAHVPWDGPGIRILEHRAHAPGHAALLIEDRGVLVAGDMLSDTLMPFLDLEAADPIGDYLAALDLFESVADGLDTVVPGHGSVGRGPEVRARIAQDRAYVVAVRDGSTPDDPRIQPTGPMYWLADVHAWQVQRLTEKHSS
jgi:glyoxylase-like metal-dependent hydrolase (beta-lactamase superfamily II)